MASLPRGGTREIHGRCRGDVGEIQAEWLLSLVEVRVRVRLRVRVRVVTLVLREGEG